MKKRFVTGTLCIAFLAFGSLASATSYTTTLSFDGTGQYKYSDDIPEYGPVPTLFTGASSLDAYGPFFGVGSATYGISWDIPDRNTPYHWTLDVDLFAIGTYTDTIPVFEDEIFSGWESVTHTFDESYIESFDLGKFALGEHDTAIQAAISFIGGLPNPGYNPSIGGYFLDGDWNVGTLSLALSTPVPGSLQTSLLLGADVTFGGVISLTATEPVPEPATMILFGTGLAGLAGYRKRKAMKK